MPYNNYCCAGVAHLVERDLAKVEVASSSLVARSKKKHHPSGWCFFLVKSGRGLKGHERSEKNMPVACFGACVRVAARQGRQRASSPTPKNTTHQGWCFFQSGKDCDRPWGDSAHQKPPSGRWFFAFISSPAGCRRAGSAPRDPGGCGENRGRRRRIRSRYRYARP